MNETVYLSDARGPLRIESSRTAMEEIRQRAREGLMAAPRVGMGVGGLLLGVRENGRIRLLDSVEIPCSHSGGPSFNLTAEEKREGHAMIAEAGAASVSGRVDVIGWYCSKTRGYATLNESDLNLYAELFPDSWPIALVVRPSAMEPMHAAFFFRDENGGVVKGVECEVEEWRPAPVIESAAIQAAAKTDIAVPAVSGASSKVVEISAPAPKLVAAPYLAEPPRLVEVPKPAPTAPPEVFLPAETRLADIIGLSSPDEGALAGEAPVKPAM